MGVYPGEGYVKFCQQVLAGGIGQKPDLRPHHRAKLGQHLGIQYIGLGQPTGGTGKISHPLGIDHCNRETGYAQDCGDRHLQSSGGLHNHHCRPQVRQFLTAAGVKPQPIR